MSDDSDLDHPQKQAIVDEENNNDNEALIYHNRVLIISLTANFLIFILFFLSIIIPWWISRNESSETIRYLVSERISTSSKAFANATENMMRRYEIVGTQLKDISYDPNLAHCSASGMLNFIRYAQTMKSILNPKPFRFYLGHNRTGSCQIELYHSDYHKFDIHMILPLNQTHDQLKFFDEETDFSPDHFKPEDSNFGKLLKIIPVSESTLTFINNKDFYSVPYWTGAIAHYGDLSENRTLTFIYPHRNYSDPFSTTLSGVVILNNEIFNFLNYIPSSSQISWIILDDNYNILMDKQYGPIQPINIVNSIPQFPNVENSRNVLWREASRFVYNLKNEVPLLISMNETQYYLIKRQISTYNGRLTFNIFMMISLDEPSTEVFKPVNYIVLSILFLANTSIFLRWYLIQKTKKKRDKKLFLAYKEKNMPESNVFNSENNGNNGFDDVNIQRNLERSDSLMNLRFPLFNTGTVGKVIIESRNLELLYPEEIMINKIVNSAVNNFSKTRNRLFSLLYVSEKGKNCELCKYLNAESLKFSKTDDQFIPSQKQQQNFLLFSQKMMKMRLVHSSKDDHIFHPYKYINLKTKQIITQDLLDENFQEELSESIDAGNASFSNLKINNSDNYYLNQEENPFITWEVLSFNNISKSSSISNFKGSDDNDSDIKYVNNHVAYNIRNEIIFKLIELVHKKKLIFVDIDPDQLIEFALYFSNIFLKNPYKTYESLKTIDYLFSMDFHTWISNKLDKFSLILSIFIRDIESITDEEVISFMNNERSSFIIDNNNDDNDSDNKNINDNDNCSTLNKDSKQNKGDSSIDYQATLNIFDLPFFDICNEKLFSPCSSYYDSNSDDDLDDKQSDKAPHRLSTKINISNKISEDNKNADENNVQVERDIFTLNDMHSKQMRQMHIFKYVFEKYIPLSQHDFNHVYIIQRIQRLFEACNISDHFEIFGEFENRAGSSEFSVIGNCEDINIFMEAIFAFTDYSRYWCDSENFNNIFEEYNHQVFTEEELKNNEFVWSFHDEIMSKIVKPFFQLLSIFCPMKEMEKRINNISMLIQLKMNGNQINMFSDNFKVVGDSEISGSSYSISHDSNSINNQHSINLGNQKKEQKKDPKELSLYRRISSSIISNEYDDEFIDDGNGEDVDGD